MPRRLVSETGLQLVMSLEGYRRSSALLADGRWTIGYGHTKSARRGASVSEADARALLIYDLMEVAEVLETVVFTPLNQNQFDALGSFAFNIGLDNFRQSMVPRWVNQGAPLQAAYAMEQWRKTDLEGEAIVVDGLVRRRAVEKSLFLTPPDGWIPAPTPVVPPRIDHGLVNFDAQPVQLRTSLTGDVAKAERVREIEPLIVLSPSPRPDVLAEPEIVAPFPTAAAPSTPVLGTPIDGPVIADEAWIDPPTPVTPPPAVAPPPEREPLDLVTPLPTGKPSAIRAKFGDFEFSTVEPVPPSYGPWAALGIFGLIVFVVALFWAISAHGPAGPFSPQVIGVLFALAGVACVVCAVYSLIQHFLGRED